MSTAKNKATVYILVIAVALVWGIIIYKVVDAMSGDDQAAVTAPAITATKEPLNDYALKEDTSKLLLNYPDPFGDEKKIAKVDTQQIPLNKLIRPVNHNATKPAVSKLIINWGFIRYSGYIGNPHSKKLVAIVTINGRSLMMTEGESADQVKLLRNMRDSIKVTYQNHIKFIPVTSGS